MTVRVGKLIVRTTQRGAGRDAGFRVRSESLLRSADLLPPGLPERAILVVRRLELPALDGTAAQRTITALSDLRRAAARPASGPVGTSASAVLFGDEVELLTCLTADLAHGVAGQRWYWREIMPAVPAGGGDALAAVWAAQARWLPASLAGLPEPEARRAVSLLSPPQARRVTRAMLAAFTVEERPPPGSPDGMPTADRGRADPPWRPWLAATSLAPDAEALLGVALSLYHAPALARRPAFAERLASWRAAADDAGRLATSAADAPLPQDATRSADANPSRDATRSADAPPPPDATRSADTLPPRDATRSAGASAARAGRGDGWPARASRTADAAATIAGPGGSGAMPPPQAQALIAEPASAAPAVDRMSDDERMGPATRKPGTAAPGHPRGEPTLERRHGSHVAAGDCPAWPGEGIATGLAPILFLANFALWLDPGEDARVPTGWALVELLGRHLLGPQLDELAEDPLWELLAELDGRRPGTLPAVELEDADPLRLPQAWLRRWPPPSSAYVARLRGTRLTVEHQEARFAVADVPCPGDSFDEVCAAEAARLGAAEIIMAGRGADPGCTPEQRFGDAIGAFVGWLLHSRQISVEALVSPGRVYVTGTHVDVVIGLQDVDLAVRASGLDRDPGWVPVLGRIVLFHFLEVP